MKTSDDKKVESKEETKKNSLVNNINAKKKQVHLNLKANQRCLMKIITI